jgi:hypothetical protein
VPIYALALRPSVGRIIGIYGLPVGLILTQMFEEIKGLSASLGVRELIDDGTPRYARHSMTRYSSRASLYATVRYDETCGFQFRGSSSHGSEQGSSSVSQRRTSSQAWPASRAGLRTRSGVLASYARTDRMVEPDDTGTN